jgi:hypothetical protein
MCQFRRDTRYRPDGADKVAPHWDIIRPVWSRVYRWYGELALLERDVAERTGALPADRWLADLERIERAVARLHTPSGYASEAYTLREHVALVRRAVLARTTSRQPAAIAAG